MKNHYDKEFYKFNKSTAESSAKIIMEYIIGKLKSKSLVDFGCGSGVWLAEGCKNIEARHGRGGIYKGLDGSWVDPDTLAYPKEYFQTADLSKEMDLKQKFDLAISLEVAEHIQESCADIFIDNICRHADIILFSAAIPLMGGTDHVNEQYPSYWISKYKDRGYEVYDCLRSKYWNDPDILPCYKQDIMIYCKKELYPHIVEIFGEIAPLTDIVHPEKYEEAKAVDKLINRAFLMEHLPRNIFYWLKKIYTRVVPNKK